MMIFKFPQQKIVFIPGYTVVIPTSHQFLPVFIELKWAFNISLLNTKGQSDTRRKPMKAGHDMNKQRHQEETEKMKGTKKHFLKISN